MCISQSFHSFMAVTPPSKDSHHPNQFHLISTLVGKRPALLLVWVCCVCECECVVCVVHVCSPSSCVCCHRLEVQTSTGFQVHRPSQVMIILDVTPRKVCVFCFNLFPFGVALTQTLHAPMPHPWHTTQGIPVQAVLTSISCEQSLPLRWGGIAVSLTLWLAAVCLYVVSDFVLLRFRLLLVMSWKPSRCVWLVWW